MRDKIKIIIADTDEKLSETLRQYLNDSGQMQVVETVKDGYDLLKGVDKWKPDIVLMDMILPKVDGLEALQKLKERQQAPEVIITSLLDNCKMIRCALELGATYYICKPYSCNNVYERILQVCDFQKTYQSAKIYSGIFEETAKSPYQQQSSLENEVTVLIRKLGIPAHIKGYQYIREGILLSYNDSNMLNYITKFLYPTIAKKYKTTSSSVERAIRHAIGVAWERGNASAIKELYGYSFPDSPVRPTNSEFLAVIVDKMRLKYKKNA